MEVLWRIIASVGVEMVRKDGILPISYRVLELSACSWR